MALLAAPSDPKDPDYYPFPKFPKQQGSTKEPTLAERAEIGDPAVFSSEYFDHEGFGATNKSLARQRLERAEQRGTQVLGGHHYLAGVEHVEASTPHVEERSKRGMDRGEVGAWYTGPPPQDPREKAGQEPRAVPSSVAGRVVLGGEKARATSYKTTPPVQGWRDRTRDPTVYGGGWKANPWREQYYQEHAQTYAWQRRPIAFELLGWCLARKP